MDVRYKNELKDKADKTKEEEVEAWNLVFARQYLSKIYRAKQRESIRNR